MLIRDGEIAAVGAGSETPRDEVGNATRLDAHGCVVAPVAAFALSAVFIGTGGALWGYSLFYLRPEIFLAIGVAADMVLMAIIGGHGTVAGPVIGALLIVGFNEWSVSEFGSSELNLTITGALLVGALLVGALLFFFGGIVGSVRARGRLPRILDWD